MRIRSLPSRLLGAFLGAALFILAPGPQALDVFAQTVRSAPAAPVVFTPTPVVGSVRLDAVVSPLPALPAAPLSSPMALPTPLPALGSARAAQGARVAEAAPQMPTVEAAKNVLETSARRAAADTSPQAASAGPKSVLLIEALHAIGGSGDHAENVKSALLGTAGPQAPDVLIRDVDFFFNSTPAEIVRFLKENRVGVINISASVNTPARSVPSLWGDLPTPAEDPEVAHGEELRRKAIARWNAVLSDPELDVNVVVAAPNHAGQDGSTVNGWDIASKMREDGGVVYDHLAPFFPSEGTPFPHIDLDARIPGTGQTFGEKVAIVGGVRAEASGYGPAVRLFTSSRWNGERGNSFAAPKIAGLLWRLRTGLPLGAAEASRLLTERLTRPYAYRRGGESFVSAKVPLAPWGWLNRLLSERAFQKAATAVRTDAPVRASSNPPESSQAPRAPPASDGFNKKAVVALFITGTLSMASFILTSIAYPFVAAPAVGWAVYGTLMALGPLAAIATGPLNGALADKLSARNSMVINVGLRAVLTLALPAFSYFGVLNFWTLLLSSIANGWVLSSTMTTDNAYIRRLAGKHVETVTALRSVHYVAMQVFLGLILGVGALIDSWNPLVPFLISAVVHGLLVVPILWFTMPTDAPAARPKTPGKPAFSILPFLKKYGLEIALLVGAVALYAASGPLLAALAPYALPKLAVGILKSSLPITAALFFWVFRSDTVRALRAGEYREPSPREKEIAARLAELDAAGKGGEEEALGLRREARTWRVRQFASVIYSSIQAVLTYPLQNFALPLIATTLVGATGKALLLGMLSGAMFFGNLISNSSQVKLPALAVPFTGKKVAGQRLVQAGVLALASTWVYLSLVPGSLPAAAAAAVIVAGLIALTSRLTHRGWIQFLGLGLLAIWAPYLLWTMPALAPWLSVKTAFFLTMLLYGMFTGPAAVSFSTYTQTNTRREDLGKVFGTSSSFFNTFNSMGYGLLSLAAGLLAQAFPALLLPIGLAYVLGALLFWRAPKRLPGLPDKVFQEKEKKG